MRGLLLSAAEFCNESNYNVLQMVNLMQLNKLKRSLETQIFYSFDLKMANSYFGLGTCSSKFNCVFCEMPSDEFEADLRTPIRGGGYPRTLGSIRKYALEYQQALKSHTAKAKLSSQKWKSCENLPVCYWEGDSVKIEELCAPRYVPKYFEILPNYILYIP